MFKIGTACQVGEVYKDKFIKFDNTTIGGTTQKSLRSLTESKQYDKIVSKVKQNLVALHNQIQHISSLDERLRMFRISSDLLPFYDHEEFSQLYDEPLMRLIKTQLHKTGKLAKSSGVLLSSHPGQFTVINSDRPDVVTNSIRHLQYHRDFLSMLDLTANDTVINIHFSGRTNNIPVNELGGLKSWLSLENDERTGDTDRVLTACEQYGIRMVFDIHHHYCNTGEYLNVNNERVQDILGTWDGYTRRPKVHVSSPRGYVNKRDMCAHSDVLDCSVYQQVLDFSQHFDIMVEAKHKNVAAEKLLTSLN